MCARLAHIIMCDKKQMWDDSCTMFVSSLHVEKKRNFVTLIHLLTHQFVIISLTE